MEIVICWYRWHAHGYIASSCTNYTQVLIYSLGLICVSKIHMDITYTAVAVSTVSHSVVIRLTDFFILIIVYIVLITQAHGRH